MAEHPLWDREVVGSNPGRAIPKALKMVPVATLLCAQHYKASTGFSCPNKYRTTNIGGRTGLVVRASDSGSGDPGSILGRVSVLFP